MTATQYDIIDVRCTHRSCSDKTTAYRMVGHCRNCHADPLIGLFTSGHEAGGGVLSSATCPACGCHTVYWDKLAGPDDVAPREVQP